jgi:ketosteroid isomerase-like protein
MRVFTRLQVAVALVAAGTSACAPGAPTSLPSEDVEAIRAASRGYNQAATDTAWARWATFFTEDAAFFPPNTPAKEGRAAIEAWGRSFPPFRDLRLETSEIVGLADLAYARGRYSMVLLPPGSPAVPDSGKYIEIWRKQSDGTWKLVRDIFNSDLPLPTPTPVPAQRPK